MKVKLWILKIKAIQSEKLNLIDKLLMTGKNHLSLSLKKKKLQLNRELTSPLDSGSSSMSFFSLFFDDELLDDIMFQTNVHNTASANNQETKPAQPLEVDELKKVFCVILFMDIEKFPNRRLYWKYFTLSKFIADANISPNWFEEILSILHFNDKSLQKPVGGPNYKPLFKLKPTVIISKIYLEQLQFLKLW